MQEIIYLDNAATTALAPEVKKILVEHLDFFGNPSSIHQLGRTSKALIEQARKQIAKYLNAKASEIIFTSGGTEADNMAIHCAIYDLKVKHIISSKIEHPAVRETLLYYQQERQIQVHFLPVDDKGNIFLSDLEAQLAQLSEPVLVSLMHANNELGTLLDIEKVAALCQQYQAFLHVDTVQTFGLLPIDTQAIPVHFLTASAHKFHGPKGIGVLFKKENIAFQHWIKGGGQERQMRAGTENFLGIIGLAKAIELLEPEKTYSYLEELRTYTWKNLQEKIPNIKMNSPKQGLPSILNIQFPIFPKEANLLFLLDLQGICVSGKSACASGSTQPSPILQACGIDTERANVRLSFSKYTTQQEIDQLVKVLEQIVVPVLV